MSTLEMSTLVTFAKTKGFVYQGSEIYGGLANSWDYGPLGALLKENIKNLWIKEFVQKRKDMVLLDASIMMNPNVWVASGHVGSFTDPLIECRHCHKRIRADKYIEESTSGQEINEILRTFLINSVKTWSEETWKSCYDDEDIKVFRKPFDE